MRTTKFGANFLNFVVLPSYLYFSGLGMEAILHNWLLTCTAEALFYAVLWYLLQNLVFVLKISDERGSHFFTFLHTFF